MASAAVLPNPLFALTATPDLPPLRPRITRRRNTPQQGRAIELLGHAIDYLVDSRLHEGGPQRTDNQAIRILMACSRAVFEEGAVIVPVHQRVSHWVQHRLRRRAVHPAAL